MSVDEFILSHGLNLPEADRKDLSERAFNVWIDGLWNSLRTLAQALSDETLPLERPNGFVREVLRCMSQWEVESAT